MPVNTTALQSIRDLTPYALANLAQTAGPDAADSPGADFLDTVRLSFIEAAEFAEGTPDEDAAHEAADGAVPIYNHARMLALVDLAAWQEDIEDLASGSGSVDMIDLAALALYQVAQRLFLALRDEYEQADEDAVGDEAAAL